MLAAALVAWTLLPGALSQAKTHILLLAQFALAVIPAVSLYFLHRKRPAVLRTIAERLQIYSSNVPLCIAASMLLPLLLRLLLLPVIPPPVPLVPDEFGHLLIAETLAAGRLANPPHTLWRHFETSYVLQQPMYASKYPIGQGTILAVGRVLTGTPWAGVLAAVMLMSGAITWMLFGCLTPAWAAVGGLLAAIDFGLAFPWIDSYWGGAFCAFGGALLFGALCRLRKMPTAMMGFLVGIGWAIVWLIRPFESVLLFFLVWCFFAVMLYLEPRGWRKWFAPVLMVLCLQISAGFVTALHNRAVTGSFTTLPYALSRRVYGVPTNFVWQAAVKEPAFRTTQLQQTYQWQRDVKLEAQTNPLAHYREILFAFWRFFLTPWYTLPLVFLPVLIKEREVLLACAIVIGAIAGSGLYPFFWPHYIAAYACVIFYLVIRGLMALHRWSFRGRPIGQFVAIFIIIGGTTLWLRVIPPTIVPGIREPLEFRAQVQQRLEKMGGRHVVLVRYAPNHNFRQEWVYNAADIDASPVVWCRFMGAPDDHEVIQYYKNRRLWLLDVDSDPVRLSLFLPKDQSESSAEGERLTQLEKSVKSQSRPSAGSPSQFDSASHND